LQQKIIGQTTVPLTRDHLGESNLGDLVADAMLEKTQADGAEIALINSGGLRNDLTIGPITLGQLLEVLPFGNTIVRVDLTGEQIWTALENGLSRIEEGAGRFPQVSGLRIVWNPTAAPGSRVVSVQVRHRDSSLAPLRPTQIYRVVTNNFMATGGDGYHVVSQGQNILDTGLLLVDVVTEYIVAQSPLKIQTEQRILNPRSP
ncbi:hypothetical protein DO97_16475, partial [Neosynechococcus sphagnicola sy1]